MATPVIADLIDQIQQDWNTPAFWWEFASVVASIFIGWYVARTIQRRLDTSPSQDANDKHIVVQLGVESFSRVLSPGVSLILLVVSRKILVRWQNTELLSLFIPIVGSLVLIRLMFYIIRKTFAQNGQIGSFISNFEKFFAGMVWLGVVMYFTGFWQEIADTLNETILPIGKSKISVMTILQGVFSVIVTVIVALWAATVLEHKLMQVSTLHSSLKVVLSRAGKAVFLIFAILISLSMVGIDLTVLSVFGGALGVGLGFGLQKITSSYVSGFIILLDRSLSIGDTINVDKYSGRVTQINTRYTVIQGVDGGESIIPNEMLVSNPVQNYSLSDPKIVLWSDFTVAYGTDLETHLSGLVECVKTVSRVISDPDPAAFLMKFGQDGYDLRVTFWIADPENGKSSIISDVNLAINRYLVQHDISLPYPHRMVKMMDA